MPRLRLIGATQEATMRAILRGLIASIVFAGLCLGVLAPVADEACDEHADECIAVSEENAEGCNERCEYVSDVDDRLGCQNRCDSRLNRRQKECRQLQRECSSSAASTTNEEALFGSKRTGQDGCYFGECPDNLEEQIESRKRTPRREPAPERERESVDDDYPAEHWPPRTVHTAATTAICQTAAFWCQMSQRGTVGSYCYCNTLWGPVYGITVPEQ
jgi:hypothetical protein